MVNKSSKSYTVTHTLFCNGAMVGSSRVQNATSRQQANTIREALIQKVVDECGGTVLYRSHSTLVIKQRHTTSRVEFDVLHSSMAYAKVAA